MVAIQPSGPKSYPLNVFARVTLDGSGNGIASIGPTRVREHWQPTAASVAVAPVPPATSVVKNATCKVFRGSSARADTFVSTTINGSTGDTCGLGGQDMQTGMQIFAQWIGGDAGGIATVNVIGEYTIGSPR